MSLIYVETREDFEKVILSDEHTPLLREFKSFITPGLDAANGYIFETSTNKKFLISFSKSDDGSAIEGYFVEKKIKILNYYYYTSIYHLSPRVNILYDIIINQKKPSIISYRSHGDIKEKFFFTGNNKIYKSIEYMVDGNIIEKFKDNSTNISVKCIKKDFKHKLISIDYYINNQVINYLDIKNIFPHLKDLEKIKDYDLTKNLSTEEINLLQMMYI